jgi:sarcosine oxidase
MKVAIIGGGAVGCAAARFFAKADHKTHLYEQFFIGHSYGSSHGTSRITRKTYPDPYYTSLMHEAFPLWHELQQEANEQIYVETGLLTIGEPNNIWLKDCIKSLHQNHIAYDSFGPVETARKFGGFHLEPNEIAIFQKEAGYLKSERVLELQAQIAQKHGAKIFQNKKVFPNEKGEIENEKYDFIAVCTGSWVKDFVKINVEPRLQHFAYFNASVSDNIPVWIDAGEKHAYGLPNYGRGFKVGIHEYGETFNPEVKNRNLNPQTIKSISEIAKLRLGANAIPNETFTCLYTVAPNEDFRTGCLPYETPGIYVSACSGHGFKFSIWFGKLLLDIAEGKRRIEDYPRFLGL